VLPCRREILQVGSKLNFRSPARQVRIDTDSPDFISWDDINGIDEVKQEIQVGEKSTLLQPCARAM
jgi:hypothetical protein